MKLIGSGGMKARRTLFVFAMAAGLSSAACTSGTTANCSADAGGTPNSDPNAWCGVPAGEGGEPMPSEGGPADSATETGAMPDAGRPEAASPEAAADAPAG